MSTNIPTVLKWHQVAALTPIQFEAYCDQLQAFSQRILYDGDLECSAELRAAGWSPEPLNAADPMMSWRWRKPGKLLSSGRRTKGQLYYSPTQARTALRSIQSKKRRSRLKP